MLLILTPGRGLLFYAGATGWGIWMLVGAR
jgi:hypothetical protein